MTDYRWQYLEPSAEPLPTGELPPSLEQIELSKAISLKRIADAIEGIDSEWRLVNALLAKGA